MDRLETLRVFVAVAQRLSFAEAARSLRLSPAAASRAVAELEGRLGATLLRRTTRSVALTPEGAAYLERARRVLDDLEDADRSLRGEDAVPRGTLVVTAPVAFGRMHVAPVVEALLRQHLALIIQLTLTDRVVSLVEEGVDVAVRIAELADSSLHAVRLSQTRRVLVASPAYIEARGAPADVSALSRHDLIVFEGFAPNGEWRFTAAGRPALRVTPRLTTNNIDVAIDAALAGLGIARALSYQVDAHLEAGRLALVLPQLEPPLVPVSLVFQANRRGSPNVRAFIEAMRARGLDR